MKARMMMLEAVATVAVFGASLVVGGEAPVCSAGCDGGGVCAVAPDKPDAVKACPVLGKNAVLNTPALAALVAAKVPLTILDARSGKFDDGKRIAGAKSLNAEVSNEDIAKALPDKSALVVTYCAGLKCSASNKLATKLRELGYANVVEYPQGIAGWVEAGRPVDEPKK